MYKIGDFSVLAKTTIKTLRFYEKQDLFKPAKVDDNGYRYYDASQLVELVKIVSLRQIGFTIKEIKKIIEGAQLDEFLNLKLAELEKMQQENIYRISKIKYLMGEKNMKYEVVFKDLPDYYVYYKKGVLDSFADANGFILQSGEECMKLNPDIKCIEPDYCFIEYLDGEYKEKNIKIRYCQAVVKPGKEDDNIKFEKLKQCKAVCVYHKGSYNTISEAYSFILNYIAENNLQINGFLRERYIDGVWNKENEEDWLTEIQVPIK